MYFDDNHHDDHWNLPAFHINCPNFVYMSMHMFMYMHVYVNVYVYVDVYVYANVYVHVDVYDVYIYIC